MTTRTNFPVSRIINGPKFYFKAYYDVQPWSGNSRYFLCMESDFQDRPPGPDDRITLGMVDLEKHDFIPLSETKAWNFQQGCMPHWMPGAADKEIIFNARENGRLCSIALNVHTRKQRILPLPIQAITADGRFGASLNYARWGEWRPGYGYAGVHDPFHGQAEPREDAIHLMNLHTGKQKTLVTYGDIARLTSDLDGRNGSPMHLCHLMFNADGSRLAGIVRWWSPHLASNVFGTKLNIDGAVPERRHCLWVVNTGGGGLEIVVNDGLVSHADWLDNNRILAWANARYDLPPAYILFDVRDQSFEVIGKDFLLCDGHMSYHPQKKQWLLTDTYPDERHMRILKLYNTRENREVILGKFHALPDLQCELRCDLHPTWNRDGDRVAIDSIHEEGKRAVYVLDVGNVDLL